MLLNSILKKIKNNSPISLSSPYKKAAVAIIIHMIKDIPHLIIVKRSEKLKEHPGQLAFPGGRLEKKDASLIDTAIRETKEEIGIDLKESDFIGRIDDFITNTSYHIVPFVFYYKNDQDYLLSDEHEDIYDISLPFLLDINNEKSKKGFYFEREWILYSYQLENGRIIWGATGCMLNDFLSVLRS